MTLKLSLWVVAVYWSGSQLINSGRMEEPYVPFERPAGTRVPGGPTTASPGAVFRSSEPGLAVTSDTPPYASVGEA